LKLFIEIANGRSFEIHLSVTQVIERRYELTNDISTLRTLKGRWEKANCSALAQSKLGNFCRTREMKQYNVSYRG